MTSMFGFCKYTISWLFNWVKRGAEVDNYCYWVILIYLQNHIFKSTLRGGHMYPFGYAGAWRSSPQSV